MTDKIIFLYYFYLNNILSVLKYMFLLYIIFMICIMIIDTVTTKNFNNASFKIYSLVYLLILITDSIDLFIYKFLKSDYIIFCRIRFVIMFMALLKIYSLIKSGDITYYIDEEDISMKSPFSTTIWIIFGILFSYTASFRASITYTLTIILFQSLFEYLNSKIDFSQKIILILINIIEILLYSLIINYVYTFNYLKAFLIGGIIKIIFNILLISINELLLNYILKNMYHKK